VRGKSAAVRHVLLGALVGATFVGAAACSGESRGATAGAAAAASGAPGSSDAPGGAGRRVAPSITLAASDVMTVERTMIEEGTPVTGDLLPIESVEIRARLEGDVEDVFVREGERVAAGQRLAQIEANEPLSNQRSAEADRAAAETELSTAQWNLDQTAELYKAGAVAEREVKAAQQSVAAARARVAAAEARLHSTGETVRDTRVAAPTTGVIDKRTVEPGEHVARGAALFTLVRSDVLELGASVPARRANDVRVGQVVHFTADGRQFDGRVARVSPTIDPATRAVTVYVQIPNPAGQLKGGTFATGRIVNRTIPGALVVPTAALRQAADSAGVFVYRVVGTTLDVAQVRIGVVDEARGVAEVLEGLREGDRVVVGNVGTLGKGMKVQVIGSRG
jgi:membrane fusion protein, multidrug efflux system